MSASRGAHRRPLHPRLASLCSSKRIVSVGRGILSQNPLEKFHLNPEPRHIGARGDLKSIGMVVSECTRNGKEAVEIRYYISSLAVSVKRFAHAVRGHWGIENSCHWSLDVTHREDESRIRDKHVRENFAWLSRLTLSLLKQHPSREGLAMKCRSCDWSDDFLLEVLNGATI